MGKRSEQTSHQRRYTDGMDAQYRMSFSSVGNCKLKQQVTTTYILEQAFPGGSDGKESACNAGDSGSVPGLGRSLRREWQPTPVFLLGEFHGWRSLVGYSLWDCKESDTTEGLTFSLSTTSSPYGSVGEFFLLSK